MENMIKQFENKEFGKLEVLMIGDKPYFSVTENLCTLRCRKIRLIANHQHF